MGDGRYYSFYKFFCVNAVMIISLGVLASALIGYYRNTSKNPILEISKMLMLIFVITLFNMVELVIPSITIAYAIRCLNALVLIWVYLTFYNYLNVKYLKGYRYNFNREILAVVFILMALSIFTHGKIILQEYAFLVFSFSSFYIGIMLLLALLNFLIVIRVFTLKERIHKAYSNKALAFIVLFFLFFPLLLYNYLILSHIGYLHLSEYLILTTMIFVLNGIVYSQSPEGITVLAFDKIGDMINDYVFVSDTNGNIIYKNQSAKQAEFFNAIELLNDREIHRLFKIPIEIYQNEEGLEFIKLKYTEEFNYFTYKYKMLKDDGIVIGQMITIVDITELINMGDSLKDKRIKMKAANYDLEKYAKVVYQIEKEKEISNLFEDVVNSNEMKMENLIQQIESISVDNEEFEQRIIEIIKYNQRVLDDVREAVSAYRTHYGS